MNSVSPGASATVAGGQRRRDRRSCRHGNRRAQHSQLSRRRGVAGASDPPRAGVARYRLSDTRPERTIEPDRVLVLSACAARRAVDPRGGPPSGTVAPSSATPSRPARVRALPDLHPRDPTALGADANPAPGSHRAFQRPPPARQRRRRPVPRPPVATAAPGPARAGRTFRPDIEGLRAVAVALVVAFHAGFPGSPRFCRRRRVLRHPGFPITGLLFDEVERTGSINFAAFYARRARRLLPMALLVLVAVAVAMGVLQAARLPSQGRFDAISAALYYSNWQFAPRIGQLPDARRRAESSAALLVAGRRGAVLPAVAIASPWPSSSAGAAGAGRRSAGGTSSPLSAGARSPIRWSRLRPSRRSRTSR